MVGLLRPAHVHVRRRVVISIVQASRKWTPTQPSRRGVGNNAYSGRNSGIGAFGL